MRIEQLGDGEPEIAILAAVHGDEPCGVHAVERLLADDPAVERPVKFVVANERALARGVRYTESDLNRVFPGSPDADSHEERLAHYLLNELRGLTTFSMHSTQSYDEPFAVVDEAGALADSICPYLSVDAVVEATGFTEGRLVEYADVVEVECGLQGTSKAAENAVTLAYEFLAAVGALPSERTPAEEVPVFRLRKLVPKRTAEEYAVFAANFQRVAAGEPFAAIDGEKLVADEPFYPVLMSPYGYEEEFGYAGELSGQLGGDPVQRDSATRSSSG
ncbi:succinylglutamate desuccinylase/aspartoacylase domain-containing protein [Halomarina oriensis]|uniref:Succinylglutamate desuccinylase n=1 Tax=Halomarina oriensis TaxID=671145 RepID=A0A6B0GPG8_9EURY|nr:succinylglutamate desuccinylase/aspartoacylase family protein [Halomarina oriensis]MWG36722.1 succinylglutamate desuccinylase [Halomarina oriensis]